MLRGCVVYPAVFINYRGEDSHSYGALLYTELARQFGKDRVFLDCESIPPAPTSSRSCSLECAQPGCCWRSSGLAG